MITKDPGDSRVVGQAAHTEGIVWKYPRAGRLEASILSCHWVTVTKPFSTLQPLKPVLLFFFCTADVFESQIQHTIDLTIIMVYSVYRRVVSEASHRKYVVLGILKKLW